MLLYSNPTRSDAGAKPHEVYASLASVGHPFGSSPLPVNAIAAYTCLNYTGHKGASLAATRMGLGEGSRCLDLGSGLGGPAIVFADETKATVIGIGENPRLRV